MAQDQGVLVEAIAVTVLELHEIWQVDKNRHSDLDLILSRVLPKFRQIPSLNPQKTVFLLFIIIFVFP